MSLARSPGAPTILGMDPQLFELGYEQGGLVYFAFGGQTMVAAVRTKENFDKALEGGLTLQQYLNSELAPNEWNAAKKIEQAVCSPR